MSFAGILPFEAIIYRRQQVGGKEKTDRFGQPTRDEAEHHREPCRITNARGKVSFEERSHDVVQTSYEMFLPKTADLLETDVVTVLDPEGNPLVERALVTLVRPITAFQSVHHIEATLTSQREATHA